MSDTYTDQRIPLITFSAFEAILDDIVDILKFEEADQRAQALDSGKAQGKLTLAVNPLDGETMTVGTQTYTFKDTLTDVDGNIQIGVDLAATKLNIVAAFDLSGVAGVQYAALMTANTNADIADFVEDDSILTAKETGPIGNTIPTTHTFSDGGNFFDAATLGTERLGIVIDEDDWGFNVTKEIHNPFQAFSEQGFRRPLVNVSFASGELKMRNKISYVNTVIYSLDIYADEISSDTEEGLTLASMSANRVARQVFKILDSPKYGNLRLQYKNSDGNLVKFIEKLSVTSIKKVFTNEPLPKENVAVAQILYGGDLNEAIADLNGSELQIVNTTVLEPTQ